MYIEFQHCTEESYICRSLIILTLPCLQESLFSYTVLLYIFPAFVFSLTSSSLYLKYTCKLVDIFSEATRENLVDDDSGIICRSHESYSANILAVRIGTFYTDIIPLWESSLS